MNLKRLTRGPAIWIVLAVAILWIGASTLLTPSVQKIDTSAGLQLLNQGKVEQAKIVDGEQRDRQAGRAGAEQVRLEPLGRDVDEAVLAELGVGPELVEVAARHPRVRHRRRDAAPRERVRLVAHERQKRGDENGGPGTVLPKQEGRDEVHRRLAPPGALHHECPPVFIDQRADRLDLPLVKVGIVATDELAQHGEPSFARVE